MNSKGTHMQSFLRTAARLTAAMLLMASSLVAAQTQPFPNKAVKVIVPTGAGGTTDIVARVIGQKLTELWGQAVLIDNRPGAGGTMGSEARRLSAVTARPLSFPALICGSATADPSNPAST